MTDETRTDADVRADDAQRVGDNAVESRAVSVGNVVRNRRGVGDEKVDKAESRGHYRDLDGRRRVVGAGQRVPDGWTRIETADLGDREGKGPAGTPAEGERPGLATAGSGVPAERTARRSRGGRRAKADDES
jgi:hypothetical protein